MTGPENNVATPAEQPKTITVSKAILATSSKFHSASSVVSKAFSDITDLCNTLDGVIDNKNAAIEALEKEVAMLKEANKVVLLKLTKLEGVETVPEAEVVPEA